MVPGKQYKPEDFLLMAWRRKWLILLPFLLASAGTMMYSRSLPNLYQSDVLILVIPQQVPRNYVASTVTTQIDQRLQSISQQVLSRSRLERLIEEFNLYPDARAKGMMEDVVQRMRDLHITVGIVKERGPNSGTSLNLAYQYKDPVIAMRVTERLASMFIEANLKDRELLAEGTDQFMEAELIAARQQLVDVEKSIEDYRRKNPWDQAEEIENNRWAAVNAQQAIANIVNEVTQGRDRLLFLEKMIADLSSPSSDAALPAQAAGPRGAPQSAAAQLEAARISLRALELRLKPDHPDVITAKRVIGELARKAEQEALAAPLSPETATARSLPPQHRDRLLNMRDEMDTLKRKIADGESKERGLRAELGAYQQRIEIYPLRVREMEALTRDYATIKNRYHDLLQKKEAARVSVNLERQQIGEQMRIVEPARVPQRPISPDRGRINLLGAALGLGFGLVLAGFFEYRDTSLRTDDDVLSALALPVMALVPVMKTTAEVQRDKRRTMIWSITGAVTLAVSAAAVIWTVRF